MEKIIILGASGYIGQRLTKKLSGEYQLCLFNRNKKKLSHLKSKTTTLYDLELIEDNREKLSSIFKEAKAVYYLMHSMSEQDGEDFDTKERDLASFVRSLCEETNVKQIIYLGGLGGEDENLSTHLKSRQKTGYILREHSTVPVTEFRAGVIIGAGGSSFEIIRTLATKLPFIPVFWRNEGKCEGVFVDTVLNYLVKSIQYKEYKDKILEIGNGDKKTYGELVQIYAKEVLNRKLFIIKMPFLEKIITPKIIGRIVAFMTGQPKELVIPLIYGVKNDAIVTDKYSFESVISEKTLNVRNVELTLSYKLAADRERKGRVQSVWDFPTNLSSLEKKSRTFFSTQEKEGMLYEEKSLSFDKALSNDVFNEILNIGSCGTGYWSMSPLWKIRGFLDRLIGGPGLQPIRQVQKENYRIGDRIDFWTIENIKNGKKTKELRLIAEMKTPGEAWLQFKIVNNPENKNKSILYLRAFFEPQGIFGYLYWYSLYIVHKLIFSSMIENIYKNTTRDKKNREYCSKTLNSVQKNVIVKLKEKSDNKIDN